MQFEALNPITNTDRNLENSGSESGRSLFLENNFADLPAPQPGKDTAAQFLPSIELANQIVLDDNVKVTGKAKPAGLTERQSSERTNFDSNDKEVGDDQRLIPGDNLRSEEKKWNYTFRPSFEPKTPRS